MERRKQALGPKTQGTDAATSTTEAMITGKSILYHCSDTREGLFIVALVKVG
jgi:hypothetical protein